MTLTPGEVLAYFRDREVSLGSKLIGLLAVAYVLSPADFCPDIIPFVGWLDDAGVLAAVAAFYLRRIGEHAARRQVLRTLPPAR